MIRLIDQPLSLQIDVAANPKAGAKKFPGGYITTNMFAQVPILLERLGVANIMDAATITVLPEEKEKENLQKDELIGLKYYILWTLHDYAEITPVIVYLVAKTAYTLNNVYPLEQADLHINRQGDGYFWLYLAENHELFQSVFGIEMFRRRDRSYLSLVDLTQTKINFVELPPNNYLGVKLLKGVPELIRTPRGITRIMPFDSTMDPYYTRYNIVPGPLRGYIETIESSTPLDNLKSLYCTSLTGDTDEFVWTLVKLILKFPGTYIAGGFVNSIVHPSVLHIPIIFENQVWVQDSFHSVLSYARGSTSTAEIGELSYVFRHILTLAEYTKLIKLFPPLALHIIETPGGNTVYIRLFNRSPDIDVFMTGSAEEVATKAVNIATALNRIKQPVTTKAYFSTEHCFTIQVNHRLPRVQLIKRAYETKEQIVAGFDIDPCGVMMYLQDGVMTIKATQAYEKSVQYGINVVTPSRQSQTFNARIIKYRRRGFEIYIAGNIYRRFRFGNIDGVLPCDIYTFRDLLRYFKYNASVVREIRSLDPMGYPLISQVGTEIIESKPIRQARPISDYNSDVGPKVAEYLHANAEIFGTSGGSFGDHRIGDLLNNGGNIRREDLFFYANTADKRDVRVKPAFRLHMYLLRLFWESVDPMTQINGSFVPTQFDYFGNGNFVQCAVSVSLQVQTEDDVHALKAHFKALRDIAGA